MTVPRRRNQRQPSATSNEPRMLRLLLPPVLLLASPVLLAAQCRVGPETNEAKLLAYYAAPSTVGGPILPGLVRPLAFAAVAPNPSRGALSLTLTGPAGQAVDITVHDVRGRLVARLPRVRLDGGFASVRWDGRDTGGRAVAAGVYLARATSSTGDDAVTRLVRLAGD